jgi:hypothetical protein
MLPTRMSNNLPMAMVLCAALTAGLAGCGRKADASRDLENAAREMEKAAPDSAAAPEAVQPSPSAPAPQAAPPPAAESQPPPAQQLNQALAAYKSGDYEDAVTKLQRLRAVRAMSTQQRMALQDAMASVMTDVYARARKGDPRAQQAVKQYEEMQTAPQNK